MKKSIAGSFIAVAIMVALDTFSRIVISLYLKHDFIVIGYETYPGFFWALLLTLIAGFTAFFGAMFALSYGSHQKIASISIYSILVIGIRYGQLHLLLERESLLYSVIALALSAIGLLLAWQVNHKMSGNKPSNGSEKEKEKEKEKHHQPVNPPDEGHPPQ